MGILHVRPKWINEPKRKRKVRGRRSCIGLRVERNRDGILYFRQPNGRDDFITWHLYPSGEVVLRSYRIVEGMALKPGLFKKLRDDGHLFTGKAKTAIPLETVKGVYKEQKNGAVPANPPGQQEPIPPQKAPIPVKGVPGKQAERGARLLARLKKAQEEEQRRLYSGTGRVHTVYRTKQKTLPKPKTLPMQRSLLADGNIPKRKKAKRKAMLPVSSKSTLPQPQPLDVRPMRLQVHPGWMNPGLRSVARESAMTEARADGIEEPRTLARTTDPASREGSQGQR